MPSYLQDALLFLIDTLLGLYLLALLLRLLFQLHDVSYYNPLVQFIAQVTRPAVAPLRPLLPRWRRLDLASCLALFIMAFGKNFLLLFLKGGSTVFGLVTSWALLEIVHLLFSVYIYGILAYAVLSWFPIGYGHPIVQLLSELFEPFLEIFRRWMPPIGGIDLSPLVALIGLEALRRLVLPLLQEIAYRALIQ